MRAAKTQIIWASAQSDQSSLCAQWVAKDPSFLCGQRGLLSDWADAQADLSLRWAHIPLCWFSYALARLLSIGEVYILDVYIRNEFNFWWRFTAARFTIRNFYNPSVQNCKPNNFLKSSSILTLMSLNSAFKHVSLLHSDHYKERPNIQNKENFKLLKKL